MIAFRNQLLLPWVGIAMQLSPEVRKALIILPDSEEKIVPVRAHGRRLPRHPDSSASTNRAVEGKLRRTKTP